MQSRLEQHFQLGGPEAGVAPYLAAQGLTVERKTNSGAIGQPIYGEARLESGWICPITASVSWRADPRGRLTELRAGYGDNGCF